MPISSATTRTPDGNRATTGAITIARYSLPRWHWLALAAVGGAVLFLHIARLEEIPRGLFGDEAAIGLDALQVLRSGRDQHGEFLPLYFRSWGDFKSPLYIYAVSGVFAALGATDFSLRFTSVLFFILYLSSVYALLRRLFPRDAVVPLYGVAAAGLLPWHFVLSRIAFECNAQLGLTALAIFCVFRAFSEPGPRITAWACGAGAALALSFYTYPTARLLTLLLLAVVALFFFRRPVLRQSVVLTGTLMLGLLPTLWYARSHPGGVDARFRTLTFLFDPDLSLARKLVRWAAGTARHYDPRFLFLHGDTNGRHATGHGGQIYLVVGALAIVAVAMFVKGRAWRTPSFFKFLLACAAVSPAAAGLTRTVPHAIRSQLLGYFLVLVSCYGLAALSRLRGAAIRRLSVGAAIAILAVESTLFVADYFGRYAGRSGDWFWYYGTREAFAAIGQERPARAIVSPAIRWYVVDWYRLTLPGLTGVPITQDVPASTPGACVMYKRWRTADDVRGEDDRSVLDATPSRFSEFGRADAPVGVRCYPATER